VRFLKVLVPMQFKNTGDFLVVINEENQELHELSLGLLDRHPSVACLWWSEKRLGMLGHGVEHWDILYIKEVRVKR